MNFTTTLQPDPDNPESGDALLVFPEHITKQLKLREGQLVELVVQDRWVDDRFVEKVIVVRQVRQ